MSYELDHLKVLESEAIHVMREVAAEFERPVLLFSGGKDSIVLLRLAEKAFRPGRFPFPLMHVDTGHNFPEVIEFRDRRVREMGERLIVASVQESIDAGRVVEETGPRASRNRLQTVTLLDAIKEHGFDAAFGGARRDEERARAKERIFSFRDDFGTWDPKNQRPELWNLYNGRIKRGEHCRVFPISNWTELDVWQYIATERLEIPSIYYAHEREVFRRDGMLYATSEFTELIDGEEPFEAWVRYRTVGDMSCTGAVASTAGDARGRRDGDRGDADHRARRDARRRPRYRGRHGGPQEGGLLLMSVAVPLPGHRRAAADRHRRVGRRRQVDADRPAALRLQADLRGPARAGRAGVRAPARRRRRRRPGAADRRPARRARAGHHDRRRLPLLRHAAADVHHRRHPRPRPLHAQHGHGRVDGRPRAGAHRCAQRRSSSSRAATRSSPRCCGIPHIVVCINKMDLVDWYEEVFNRIVDEFTDFAARLEVSDVTFIPISRAEGRQRRRPLARTCRGTSGSPLLYHLEHVHIALGPQPDRRALPGAVGHPAGHRRAPRLPRLRRPGRVRACCGRATTWSCCRAARRHGSSGSTRSTGRSRRPTRRCR